MGYSRILRYSLALLCVAASVGLEVLLQPVVGDAMPFLFLWPAVVLSAWWGGQGPGLLATAVAIAAADYFLVEPRYEFGLMKPSESVWAIAFLLLGILLSVLLERLHQTRRQLERADRNKDVFLAMLGHELRGPLAAARNAAHILDKVSDRSDTAVRTVGLLNRQIEQMSRLVGDLLDISRIGNGKLRLERKSVDLSAVAARAVEASRWLVDGRKQDLVVALPEPVWVTGDEDRLVQVVQNLLQNACKYTPEGGQVRLSVQGDEREAVLQVQDNGVGLSPGMLPRVFDLFSQVDESERHAQGGLGLGLALVRRLVELHGGSVLALSPGPGQGSTFVVRLPTLVESPPEDIVSAARKAP